MGVNVFNAFRVIDVGVVLDLLRRFSSCVTLYVSDWMISLPFSASIYFAVTSASVLVLSDAANAVTGSADADRSNASPIDVTRLSRFFKKSISSSLHLKLISKLILHG